MSLKAPPKRSQPVTLSSAWDETLSFMMDKGAATEARSRYVFLICPLLLVVAIACTPSVQNDAKSATLDRAWERAPATYNQKLTVNSLHALVHKLHALAQFDGFALGHQDTTAYGVGWVGDDDRSDVSDVCGSHAAVYGWDVFRIERGALKNGDGVNFSHLQQLIRNAHALGGINTMSWHVDNPLTGGDAWDTRPAIASALPDGSSHRQFVA